MSLGKAAFQGASGAFSHEAVGLFAPGFDPVACDTFDLAFEAVRSGACTIAVLPIHNVTAGAVPEVSQGLPASGLRIVGQHDMVIRQNLMALAGVKLADVREVRTHPMAIGQCLKFLRAQDLNAVDALDTAGAARDLAASGERDVAVIAARAAAKLYGLNIIAPDIQDDPSNFTTFVVVAR